jgi:hypothetical protein
MKITCKKCGKESSSLNFPRGFGDPCGDCERDALAARPHLQRVVEVESDLLEIRVHAWRVIEYGGGLLTPQELGLFMNFTQLVEKARQRLASEIEVALLDDKKPTA